MRCDTSVWTMAGRCVNSILTVWNMSTTPSYLIRSRTILNVTKTPVRPTPALHRRTLASNYWLNNVSLKVVSKHVSEYLLPRSQVTIYQRELTITIACTDVQLNL